jgi:Asp-tRNA(Asn)/Glu-tRNA(Gln) amidotransferase A subunit family amidase
MPARTGLELLSLCDAVARLRAGELTAERYADALLRRTAELESETHAFVWLNAEHARAAARAADRVRATGTAPGLLHGVPVGVKDVIDTAGIPTEFGSPVFAGRVPPRSAAVARQLERQGGFVFGKTVTAELAYFAPGPTRNPWNPAHTPGGSSMGSAAAVAAGMVPLALGTQTNGSVIRPAAFCGCVGLKPSAGLIGRSGIQPFSPTLDQVGLFTRRVADAALALSALASTDADDPASDGATVARLQCWPLVEQVRPPRLAAVRSPVWSQAEPAQQQSFMQTLSRLRSAGARIEEIELPDAFNVAHAVHRAIMAGEAARTLGDLQQKHRVRLSSVLNRFLDEGRDVGDAALAGALAQRGVLQAQLKQFLADFDVIVTLPVRGEAPATLEHTGDPAFCTIWTLVGVPVLTLPVGFGPRGLPLGLQMVGAIEGDAQLLSVARWAEQAIAFEPDSIKITSQP